MIRLKYVYSVISVKRQRLQGNTKNRLFQRSWPIRVRFLNPWAAEKAFRPTQSSIYVPLPSPPIWIWSAKILFQNFQIFHNILLNLANFGGRPMSKSMQIPQKRIETVGNHVKTGRNLLEAFVRSRKEENLYGHSDINNARRILSKGSTLWRGCWFWSKKLQISKEFRSEFHSGGGVTFK